MTTQDQTVTQPNHRHKTNRTLRSHLLALLGFGALTALFYAPVLLGGRTFSAGDFTDHFFPFNLFQRSEILAGRLPIWNPYTYAGHPFLADLQAAVFYPVSNLILALSLPLRSDAARLYVLQVEALVHFVLAGFFTYLLVQALGGRRLPAFLSGCVFVFSGYVTGYPALQLAVLRTAIWLPLVLWLLWRALAAPDQWRWWIAAALAYTAAFLAGHAQTFLYLSYVVAAWIVVLLVCARRRHPTPASWVSLLARVAVFGLLFLGLSAAQLLPSLEFARLSVRASVDYAFVSGGFPLADTWQMLLPRLISLFSPLYVGIVALALALFALVERAGESPTPGSQPTTSPASPQTVVAFFALMTAIALLVSYGRNGFLFPLLYRWLPGWNLFQGQERAAYLVTFGLSVLAGLGAAGLDGLADRTRRRTMLVYAGLVVVALTIFSLRYLRTGQPVVAPQTLWQACFAVALVAVALATLILWPGGPARWRLSGTNRTCPG